MCGTVPFGILLTRLFGRGDLRKVGSGNIGATNVLRVGGLRMAALVWLLDMFKAVLVVWVGGLIGDPVFAAWCGFAAVFGHCFPVWLRFHGGKGVSCLFGVLLAINPILFVVCGITWLVVALTFGYSSLGAIVTFLMAAVLGFALGGGVGIALLSTCALCLVKHNENIGRLIGGTESKIVWKWKK